MIEIEEELNYKILKKHFKEQDILIAEGKMQKPKFVYDVFTPDEQEEFDLGLTWEQVFGNNLRKLNHG